ncbi:TetR/AcrR family transcriptional regulator [Alloalcanivorax xenomutans]|jgi:AcrR family transcriptional regulator|uniref:TetR/AcrR family transcriptional regulator n=1 Tax=Alloalcanivorax xenomutans TaxID=1094342 RepID=UPI0003B7F4E6|nr:hypothetical protein Q668_07405 [Alcanivorax sp. PN-3]
MPRTPQNPERRRDQLLDCAQALFFEQGYEATTVNHILQRSGLSKGGFYHYFASKEDVLEAIVARVAEHSVAQVNDLVEQDNGDALTRLNAFLRRSRQLKLETAPQLRPLFSVIFSPGHQSLFHRINQANMTLVGPLLARLIQQGIEEGRFQVPDATAAAEIIMQLGASTYDAVGRAVDAQGTPEAKAANQALERRLQFQGLAIDRILGLPDGSIRYIDPGFVEALMRLLDDTAE